MSFFDEIDWVKLQQYYKCGCVDTFEVIEVTILNLLKYLAISKQFSSFFRETDNFEVTNIIFISKLYNYFYLINSFIFK